MTLCLSEIILSNSSKRSRDSYPRFRQSKGYICHVFLLPFLLPIEEFFILVFSLKAPILAILIGVHDSSGSCSWTNASSDSAKVYLE